MDQSFGDYLEAIKARTEAERAAEVERKRLADAQERANELEVKRIKTEQARLQMMTEIAATAVNVFEIIKGVDTRLGQVEAKLGQVEARSIQAEAQQALFIEGVKDRLNVVEFDLDELKNLIWRLAGLMAGQDKFEHISQEFDYRTSLREQLVQHRQNLALLEQQKALQGAFPELHLLNQINLIMGEIETIEEKLNVKTS